MKVSYDGKSPGRFWYIRQNVRGMLHTPFNKKTRPDVKKLGINAGIFGATAWLALNIMAPYIGIPVAGWFIGGAVLTVLAGSGIKAYKTIRSLKKSTVVAEYVRAKEQKWVQSKMQPKFFSRVATKVRSILGAPARVLHLPHVPLPHLPSREPKKKFTYKPIESDSPSLAEKFAEKVTTEVTKQVVKEVVQQGTDEIRRRSEAAERRANRPRHISNF
jgi:hypothetical protein